MASFPSVMANWQTFKENRPRSVLVQNDGHLTTPLIKLHAHIIGYQARAICHLSRTQLSRACANVTSATDWNGMTQEIERSSEQSSGLIRFSDAGNIRKG